MKFLILMLFISCGHETPPEKDLADSDGDQIRNYLEESSDLKKYTASTKPFKKMKAKLSFRANTQLVTLEMSNVSDLEKITHSLMTKRKDLMKKEDFFDEWSKLRPMNPDLGLKLLGKIYEVTLLFDDSDENPDSIQLNGSHLADFKKEVKVYLTGKIIEDLLNSRTFLTLARKDSDRVWSADSDIRKKTYRVYWNDGNGSQIFYVSKELPLEKFLQLNGILNYQPFSEYGTLSWNDESKGWWIRDLGAGDWVVIASSERELAEAREKNFDKSTHEVQRLNGQGKGILNLVKAPEARLFLKIRGWKSLNTYRERVTTSVRGAGHQEGTQKCWHWHRDVLPSGDLLITTEEILSSILLATGSKIIPASDLRASALEGLDEQGSYLELMIDSTETNFSLQLPSLPATTFTRTGVYQWECEAIARETGGKRTNDEGHFHLSVSAYIEKMIE